MEPSNKALSRPRTYPRGGQPVLFSHLRLLARAATRFGLSPSETEDIGKGMDTSPGSGKFHLNRGICKRRDASMMDLKSGQYKHKRMTNRIENFFRVETHLFRLLLQLGLPLFLDGFCRFLFDIFPGVSGFGHYESPV